MGRKKVTSAGKKQLPAEDLLRLLHSQNFGKIRTLVKSGLDPNSFVGNTSCFENTTWVLRDQKPLVPLLVFSCFNGVPAPVLDLLIRLGASPNTVMDCGLPAPLAVLCAKVTAEEQRALFQVLRQHRCSTFNASVRSARNDVPIHVTCKILDLSDWTSPRKVEGVEMLLQFGTFQLPDGSLDERAMYEFLATAVRHPCGHKLLGCIWRHFPQQLVPSLPVSDCLLLRALTDSWLEPGWRHSEERQHTVTMGLILRALLEHPALQQPNREAVACWLRDNMTVLLYRPELVALLLDRCKALESPAKAGDLGAGAKLSSASPSSPPFVSRCSDSSPSLLIFHPDDRDLVLPLGLLSGPEALQGEVPLSPHMSLMLAYVADPDAQLARQGVEMLLSRGARVDLPCQLGTEVLGAGDADSNITPLMAAFVPYHRNQGLVELLWQRYAETHPAKATKEAAIRMRSAAHALFLRLPGWQVPLDSAAHAAAASSMNGAKTSSAGAAAASHTEVVTTGSLVEATPLDCSRERLRDLLDSNVLDYVDNRNLDIVETALIELLPQLSSFSSTAATEHVSSQGNRDGRSAPLNVSEQLDVVSKRVDQAHARLDEIYSSGHSDAELTEDPEVWQAEAALEALTAVQRCLERYAATTGDGGTHTFYELPAGVAFVEVIAARIIGQPEWGFSRGLLLQLGLSQMRRVLSTLQAETGTAAGVTGSDTANNANDGAGAEGSALGVTAQMEVLRLYYNELLDSMSAPERRLLEDLVSALNVAEEERNLENRNQEPAKVTVAATDSAAAPIHDGVVKTGDEAKAESANSALQAHLELSEQVSSLSLLMEEYHEEVGEDLQLCGKNDGRVRPRERTEAKGDEGALALGGAGPSAGNRCESTEQFSSSCTNSRTRSRSCSYSGSSSASSLEDGAPVAHDAVNRVLSTLTPYTTATTGGPDVSADGANSFSATVAQGLLSPEAREAMHRVMLPGEAMGDWTSDDEGSGDAGDVGTTEDGKCGDSARRKPLGQRPANNYSTNAHGGREQKNPCCSSSESSSRSGRGNSDVRIRNRRAGCSSQMCRKGYKVISKSAVSGLNNNGSSQIPAPAPQQQPRRRLKGVGSISGSAVRCRRSRRSRRRFGSDSGAAKQPEGFSTPVVEGWRNPELLLGGFNVMSLPPNVRHISGGGDGSGPSSSYDRELEPYEYIGAAVMLENYDEGAGDRVGDGRDAMCMSSAASSAYDTPSDGSGDDTASLLEGQTRACIGCGKTASASRRLSPGPEGSSGESYGTAQGGYGSSHGYGPEYGLESVGGDTGALEFSTPGRLSAACGPGRGEHGRVGAGCAPRQMVATSGVASTVGMASSTSSDMASQFLQQQQQQQQQQQPRHLEASRRGGDHQQWRNGNGNDNVNGNRTEPVIRRRSLDRVAAASGFDTAFPVTALRAAPSGGDVAAEQKRNVSYISSEVEGESSSASFNCKPRAPYKTDLAPLQANNSKALPSSCAPNADGRTQRVNADGATALANGSVHASDNGTATGMLGGTNANASVSRTSSSASSSSSAYAAGPDSCRSSLDSTRAYIVHMPSGAAADWSGLWTDSREADRGLLAAVAVTASTQDHQHQLRESSPVFNRCGGDSSDDDVHMYGSSYNYVVGGSCGDASAGDDAGFSRGNEGRWRRRNISSFKTGTIGPRAATIANSLARGCQSSGMDSSAAVGSDAGLVVGLGCRELHDGGSAAVAATTGVNAVLKPSVEGYPGRQRRRVVVRRAHAAQGLMPVDASASPDGKADADAGEPPPQPAVAAPQSGCVGLCSCSLTSEGRVTKSSGGNRRQCSQNDASHGFEASVVATIVQARQQQASSGCRDARLRGYDDSSVALDPRKEECNKCLHNGDGSSGSVSEDGIGAGARAAVRSARLNGRGVHNGAEGVQQWHAEGASSDDGYSSDASSTPTQEWPPRRSPDAACLPMVFTLGRCDAAAVQGASVAGAVHAAEVDESWLRTLPRRSLGSRSDIGNDSDSPGSVGVSGRQPDDGSRSASASETEPSSADESSSERNATSGRDGPRFQQQQRHMLSHSGSDLDSRSSVPALNGRMSCRRSSNTASSSSSITSRPTPAPGMDTKHLGLSPVVGAGSTAVPSTAMTAMISDGSVDGSALPGGTSVSNARSRPTNAIAAADIIITKTEDECTDGNAEDKSPGISARQDSAPDFSAVPLSSPSPLSSCLEPQPPPRHPVHKEEHQQASAHPLASAHAPGVAEPAAAATQPLPDRTLTALVTNLATSANVFPRTALEVQNGRVGPGPIAGRVSRTGIGAAATRALGTEASGGSAGGSDGNGLKNSYVLLLSGAFPKEGYTRPPPSVMQVLDNGPSGAEALCAWTAELRAALVASSGYEHQRLVVVADSPAPVRPAWLSALRAAIVAAVVVPALDGGGGMGGGSNGAEDARCTGAQRRGRAQGSRRQCPEWLRQTVLLLPLCHLIAPYGGAYLYQAATRACQEYGATPANAVFSVRFRAPRLWLDPECLAAAAAFAEAYPGNMYGRAILMLYANRQISRALLRSPRYGLWGLARSAETLSEVLYGSGGGGGLAAVGAVGAGDGGTAAPALPGMWPCGQMGQVSSAAQALLLLEDEDGGEDDDKNSEGDENDEDGQALRSASVTCHVIGAALSAARQMQAVWRATWPGGHSLRLASYSYLSATGYPRAVITALNWCVPLVLDGAADLSEMLSEMRLLSYNASAAITMAEEIFIPRHMGDDDGVGKSGDTEEGDEDLESDTFSQEQVSDTALAFKHFINALRASVAPSPQSTPAGQRELLPWSRLCTTQREQLVDELLTLADLLMIAHAVLLTLRTTLSYAADGGAAVMAGAAGALRREVAEVQMMRAAASRMLVERMEMQERSTESIYPTQMYNYRNHNPCRNQEQTRGSDAMQPMTSTAAKSTLGGKVEAFVPAGSGGVGHLSTSDGGSGSDEELQGEAEDRLSWRHVNGLYEHGKTILQCAADAAAAMMDVQIRKDEAARCDRIVNSLLDDQTLLDGLNALADMPSHYQLPLAPWDPAAAAAAAEAAATAATAVANGGGGDDVDAASDPALQAAVSAAAAVASLSQCNEVLYRLLVIPWDEKAEGEDDDGNGECNNDGGVCTSLAEEFDRSSWSIPTFINGDLRPLTQVRVRRLYDEARSLAAECLGSLRRINAQPLPLPHRGYGMSAEGPQAEMHAGVHKCVQGAVPSGGWRDAAAAIAVPWDLKPTDGRGRVHEEAVKTMDLPCTSAAASAAVAMQPVVVPTSAEAEDGHEDEGSEDAAWGLVEGLDDPA